MEVTQEEIDHLSRRRIKKGYTVPSKEEPFWVSAVIFAVFFFAFVGSIFSIFWVADNVIKPVIEYNERIENVERELCIANYRNKGYWVIGKDSISDCYER